MTFHHQQGDLYRLSSHFHKLQSMQETAKRCPSCGMAIQKSEGCNKMTCGACGAFFCWRCNRAVEGYDHFRAGACVLFDHGEIQRWEVELQVQIERQAPSSPAILTGHINDATPALC